MKNLNRKFLAAGLLASALAFVGCKSDKAAERTDTTEQGTTTEGTTTEGTQTDPGTGGAGTQDINKTRQTDDNLRMPEEDPMRTRESESIRESEQEPGVHDEDPGTGGAGFGTEATEEPLDEPLFEPLNEGGNVDDYTRVPDSPADTVPEEGARDEQLPEDLQ